MEGLSRRALNWRPDQVLACENGRQSTSWVSMRKLVRADHLASIAEIDLALKGMPRSLTTTLAAGAAEMARRLI